MVEVFYIDEEIKGTCFLVKGEQAILFDPGMAFYGKTVAEKVRALLGDQALSAIFLTHSHYDHVAAVPYIQEVWPDVRVYAAEHACRVFEKPKARQMMRRMSAVAAKAAGYEWEDDGRLDGLHADQALQDGDQIHIGDMTIRALTTMGHTRCSMSFMINDAIMVSSETIGLEGDETGGYIPAFLVSYRWTTESLQKTKEAQPKQLYMPHRGLIEPDERYWNDMERGLAATKTMIIDILVRYKTPEEQLAAMEALFWQQTSKGAWPKEAFDINAVAMMKTIAAEFPEEVGKA